MIEAGASRRIFTQQPNSVFRAVRRSLPGPIDRRSGGESSHHDTHQIADRPDPHRLRDRDHWRVGGDAMGGSDARLPARTRAALGDRRWPAGLSTLGAVRVVVSLRRLCRTGVRPGRHAGRRERVRRLRRGDRRVAVACAPVEQCHDLWFGPLGEWPRGGNRWLAPRCRCAARQPRQSLSTPRRSRAHHGVRADPVGQGRRSGRADLAVLHRIDRRP